MKGTILYGPRDRRFEERREPKIIGQIQTPKMRATRREWLGGRR